MHLCKDGVWRYIVVDNHFPLKSIGGKKQLLGLHSREGVDGIIEIWGELIEKAVAKIYGTYLDLCMARDEGMIELFKILTGAPHSSYGLNKDFRSFLILIDTALKRGHIATLESVREDHFEAAEMFGLSSYQAYRILSIKKTGIKLRNMADP